MHFIYIDDSTERPVNIFSAICVPCEQWNEVFERLKRWRKHLKDIHGIPLNYELHARKFLSGRGTASAIKEISRHQRAQIFHSSFKVTNWLNEVGISVFNVCNGLCCTNPVRDSSRESSVVAGMHEQTHIPDVQDKKLASLQ